MELPLEYRWLLANGFKGFVPWYVIEDEEQRTVLAKAFCKETGKAGWPFARRQDRDDVALFELQDGMPTGRVVSTHITWSGKPVSRAVASYANMFDWLTRQVIPDTQEWMSEEDLEDLEEGE